MDSDGFFGAEQVEFAGNGRYLLDVDGKGQKSYTRATTIAKTLETTFHLDQWKQKNAAKGVAMRPDLVARAIVTPVDNKPAWKEILSQAGVVAAGGAKANLGTAFHELHDNVSRMSDEEYAAVPADIRDLYEKYRAELKRLGIVELISETTVCAEQIGTAGKVDGFVRMPDGSIRVLDRKSGRVTDYPHAPAVQLAIYANANKILIDNAWSDMLTVFPTIDRETAFIVDVTYATETTPSSVHIYELDISAGWYGALLACKVRRWRNRKDLLTPYHPEKMPTPTTDREVRFTIASQQVPVSPELAKDIQPETGGTQPPNTHASPVPTVAPAQTTGTHPAWSSAQQAVIQVNADGSPATPPTTAQVAGFTYKQIQNGEHLNAAEKASQMAAAALQAADDRREVATAQAIDNRERTSIIGDIDPGSDADTLLKTYKTKAAIQAAARKLDPGMNVSRTRANLANDMTSHPQWAARRGEFIGTQEAAPPTWKPAPEQVAAAVQAQVMPGQLDPVTAASAKAEDAAAAAATQQYPNAGLPEQANPFAQPAPPADPPSAPKTPEELVLERIAAAQSKGDLAQIWEYCQDSQIPWSARLQQAAATKMSSFTN